MIGFSMQLCEFFRECIDGENCPYIDQCKTRPKIPPRERKETMDPLDKASDEFNRNLDSRPVSDDRWMTPKIELETSKPTLQIFTRLHRIGNTTYIMQRLETEEEWTPTFNIIGDFDVELKGVI